MPEPQTTHPTAGLLAAAKAGDGSAFDKLFAHVTPRLRWFVEVRLGVVLRAKLEAADLLQETYAAAWPRIGEFEDRGQGSFLRWLLRIAENCIRVAARHHGAQRRDARRQLSAADTALAMAADPHSGPCTMASRLERRTEVAAALAGLEDELRLVLLARVVEGRGLSEIAAGMERSESAVRRLVARATEALGRRLHGEDVSHA